MASVLSIRLDPETRHKLLALAQITHRTRASVIRCLIHNATISPNLLILEAAISVAPEVEDTSAPLNKKPQLKNAE